MLTKSVQFEKIEIDKYGNMSIKFSLSIVDDEENIEYHNSIHRVGLSKKEDITYVESSIASTGFGEISQSDATKIDKILTEMKKVEFPEPPQSGIL